jgi:chaperonin cofactor prefoldin
MPDQALIDRYAELTRELQRITEERNRVGRQIEEQKRVSRENKFLDQNAKVVAALAEWTIDLDWRKASKALGEPEDRCRILFENALRHIRQQDPSHWGDIPTRLGARSIARLDDWASHIRRYARSLAKD